MVNLESKTETKERCVCVWVPCQEQRRLNDGCDSLGHGVYIDSTTTWNVLVRCCLRSCLWPTRFIHLMCWQLAKRDGFFSRFFLLVVVPVRHKGQKDMTARPTLWRKRRLLTLLAVTIVFVFFFSSGTYSRLRQQPQPQQPEQIVDKEKSENVGVGPFDF